jgi:anti-sigma B factor antagonist
MVDGAKIFWFGDQPFFDERTVLEVAEQITINLPTEGAPVNRVLDFSGVSLISSTLLSKLIPLQRWVDASAGEISVRPFRGWGSAKER